MSALLRLPLALLTTSAVVLLTSGVASAEDAGAPDAAACLLDVALLGCETTQEPAQQNPPAEPAQAPTDEELAADREATDLQPDDAVPAFTGVPAQTQLGDPADQSPATASTDPQPTDELEAPAGSSTPAPAGAPDVQGALECLAGVGEEFAEALAEFLETSAGDLVAELEGQLTSIDRADLEAILTGGGGDVTELLPGVSEDTILQLVTEGQELFEMSGQDFLGCLELLLPVDPPAEEEPKPVVHPVAQPETHYENCDDARAKGAAPVHLGEPGYGAHLDSDNDGIGCEQDVMAVGHTPTPQAQLAYTGFDAWPFAGAGAAMLAAGSLLVAGARRRG